MIPTAHRSASRASRLRASRSRPWRAPLLALQFGVVLTALRPLHAQSAPDAWGVLRTETFVRPSARVSEMILAPRTNISFEALSPDGRAAVRLTGPGRGSIAAYGRAHLNIAGLQVDAVANRARALTTVASTGIEVADPRTGTTRRLETPAAATVSEPIWSPDGGRLAYLAHFENATHLYIADLATGRSTRLTRTPLLATLVTAPRFTADGRQLVAVLVPANRGAAPTHGRNGIEDGPQVRFTEGVRKPQRVHASLLQDPHDKALYTYHTTGQLALIDSRSGAARLIGAPTAIRSVDVSPDARYLRVTRVVEPYSYIVPHSAFGSVTELWDVAGKVIATLETRPLREGEVNDTPRGATPPDTARRAMAWHPAGGLTYLRTVVGANDRAIGVRFMHWTPPFGAADTALILAGGPRLTAVTWGTDAGTVFVTDSGQVAAIRLTDVTKKYPLGRGVSVPGPRAFGGDDAAGPTVAADTIGVGGALEMSRAADGSMRVAMSRDGNSVFVTGTRRYGNDWHRRAPRPWLDRIAIADAKRTRLLDSPADMYEEFVTALDADHQHVVVTRQSRTTIPDAWYRDLAAGTDRKLTNAVDVGPEISGAVRKRIRITRPRDGIQFWADVILPRDWQPGQRLPGVIWHYPREYATVEAYERSKWNININQFPAVPQLRPASSIELWVANGYALINPDMPIFGDSGRLNDNFTRDLPENLGAILDAVVDSGFVDRHRMGLGGHSYGAFGTVNAMTLMSEFKAGIAGDGMYNRTLTPFGFQSERRSFYEARDVYLDMSPFLRAPRLSGALLMYHATEDQNAGTAPLSSTRMMDALQGLGKPAALFMYHYEDHSVATFESDLDMWARWYAWFDIYVKGASAPAISTVPTSSTGPTGPTGPATTTPRTVQPGAPGAPTRVLTTQQADTLTFPKHTAADVAFMTGMIAHHQQALVMTAFVPDRTTARDIRLLAQRIELSQSDEITLMKSWLRARGEPVPGEGEHAGHDMHEGHLMPGMLTPAQIATLQAARGTDFDRHFLEFMIQHHEGAIAMVAELFSSPGGGQGSEIYGFAADVESDQQMEIARMRRLLSERP